MGLGSACGTAATQQFKTEDRERVPGGRTCAAANLVAGTRNVAMRAKEVARIISGEWRERETC